MATMRAVGVEEYGPKENFSSREVPRPNSPKGRQMIVKVEACSVNPIDTKIRNGTYDDAPDYYRFSPKGFHIIGYDGAGTVVEVGPECEHYKPGDEVYYVVNTTSQGTYAEYVLVHEISVGRKPKNLDFLEAACMGLTFGTAYQSLVDRLEIKPKEEAAVLIINGGGGVGSAAIQLARNFLELPVVIATASRPETVDFCKSMGATHVIDHRKDLKPQIEALKLGVPVRYIYIAAGTEQYIQPAADICAVYGKVCSIVQAKFDFYGTQFMSKSLSFSWCWLGSAGYHGQGLEEYGKLFKILTDLIEEGRVRPHLTKRLRLTAEGVKEAHRILESGTAIGKIALGPDEAGEGEPFH